MYNKPYESELKPYSPESVKEGLANPTMEEPGDERLRPYGIPESKD